ncbi:MULTISPECIES: CaiB/BaiF CoA transferase family protein [Shewanella]|uniref:CoA transferase n=1 Tax=Shewanella holmiensis TaxID=2952222 RepID=A0A9X3AQV4_9GAMM|nr:MULTISPECIES: CoA transferase [Shewanella]MCT7943322.1 CoA transferase [Shewanella holmiensis]MDP5148295.1 CoA transferase [Shewanella sp. ULN5]
MNNTSNTPLDGIRVLDFTQAEQGPAGTLMLADFGADVIKVERPGAGDLSRHTVGGTSVEALNNPTYVAMNRNKRSMEIDTKSEAGKQIIYELVKEMDVVVNNFRPGVMDKLGLGYEKLKEINPGIIFASATGYGPVGPYAEKPGQDMVAQALSGVMAVTADASIPSSIYPTALCDYTGAMHLCQGIMAALIGRGKTGKGRKVEVCLYDSMLSMQMQEAAYWSKYKQVLNWAAMPLAGHFMATDGPIVVIGAFMPNPLKAMCAALEIDDLTVPYPDMASQIKNKALIQNTLRQEIAKYTMADALARFDGQDVLCAPVRTLSEAMDDPQTKINHMKIEIDHPILGKMDVVGCPVHFDGEAVSLRHMAPQLGEHTEEILREFGLDGKNAG